MADQKVLPEIFNKKAAKILSYPVTKCFQVNASNINILRCVMPAGHDRYVDLSKGKEVSMLSIQILANEAGKEDTDLLVGKQPEITTLDEVVSTVYPEATKQTRKSPTSKTKTKK